MKKYLYDIVFFIGVLVWFGGSWAFGWNASAESVGEKYTDTIGFILMTYGFLNSLVRGIKTEVNFYVKEGSEIDVS